MKTYSEGDLKGSLIVKVQYIEWFFIFVRKILHTVKIYLTNKLISRAKRSVRSLVWMQNPAQS